VLFGGDRGARRHRATLHEIVVDTRPPETVGTSLLVFDGDQEVDDDGQGAKASVEGAPGHRPKHYDTTAGRFCASILAVTGHLEIAGSELAAAGGFETTALGFHGAFRAGNIGGPTDSTTTTRAKRARSNTLSNVSEPDGTWRSRGSVVGSDQHSDHSRVGFGHTRAQGGGVGRDRSQTQNNKQKFEDHPERCGVYPKEKVETSFEKVSIK